MCTEKRETCLAYQEDQREQTLQELLADLRTKNRITMFYWILKGKI